jgi:transcriptional regulator with XRE-family HTH domain
MLLSARPTEEDLMSDDDVRQLIGRRLREERKRAGYDHAKDFASALEISQSQLSRIENGERSADSGLLRRAAALLEVPMDSFFEERLSDVVLARRGDSDEDGMSRMIDWALELRRDLDLVSAYERGE